MKKSLIIFNAFLINFIFFSVIKYGEFKGGLKDGFFLFWNNYFNKTKDYDMLKVIAPYFAFRVSVVCNPLFYPNVSDNTRELMFNFAKNILEVEKFNPENINNYLK